MSALGAAEAYARHVGRYGAQHAAGLIEVAGLRRGQRVLDVGCGPGPLTSAHTEALGAENVAAFDLSEPFVEACRARVPAADVRVAVGERLPFPDASFVAVLAQLVVQLMDDRDAERAAAIDDARRVGYETPEELGALFARCGLADVATGELLVDAKYESFDDLRRPCTAGVGHSGGCFASLDGDRRAALAADAYGRLGSPDGSFELTARAWWALGTAP